MSTPKERQIRVLLCTDASIVAIPLKRALLGNTAITLHKEVPDTVSAVTAVRNHDIDIVLLDIGIGESAVHTALIRLKRADPKINIVMIGTLSFANVRTSIHGLIDGAADYVPTPTRHAAGTDQRTFKENLDRVLRALGRHKAAVITPVQPPTKAIPKISKVAPKVLLIGSSTGGPQAVADLLAGLGNNFNLPILITQHMPIGFTSIFAMSLSRRLGRNVLEGSEAHDLQPGDILIAPGGHHMQVQTHGRSPHIHLLDSPKINYCKPSVDPMFESAAAIYGAAVLAVVLTGMGHDGRDGAGTVMRAGGTVLAQDEATSVVWGMPGAVAEAGFAAEVLPLNDIAPRVLSLTSGRS